MDAREFFDRAAPSYDAEMASSATNAVRLRVQQLLSKYAPDRCAVLDFGCGTGADAAHAAEGGRRVLAYDQSSAMLARLRQRCAAPISDGVVVPVEGGLDALYRALSSFGPVQAVVANFAVLNLLPDLTDFRDLVTRRLPAVRVMILGVQNPFYLPDMGTAWWWRGLWKGRRAGAVLCDTGRVATRRYFTGTLAAAFAPAFKLRDRYGAWSPIRLLTFVRHT